MKRLAVALVLTGGTAMAHSGVTDPAVMGWMMDMKHVGSTLKHLGSMVKGTTAFDVGEIDAALRNIAANAAKIPTAFATPATDPKSEALPVIWDQFDAFTAKARDMEIVVGDLVGTVTTPADLDQALKQIGAACKACHATYRQ